MSEHLVRCPGQSSMNYKMDIFAASFFLYMCKLGT
jgi:hypothetical protein